jgi:proton glutamate symport protein
MISLTKEANSEQLTSLGSIVRDSDMADIDIKIYEPEKAKEEKAFFKTFIESMIPENIFSALNSGSSLKVLFFSILFGSAIGSICKTTSHSLLTSLESVSLAFGKVIQWLMYMLPFGLISLIAQDVSIVGLNALIAMMGFIPFALIGVFLLFIVSSIIFYIRTGSFVKPNSALKESMYVALGTGNAFACLESSRIAMRDKLGYREKDIDLLVPLTFTICRTGPTLYFSLATMFVAHLYDVEISYTSMLTVIIFSILAGLATAGSSGATIISMISIVLTPLDLPTEAIFVLLSVIDPILGPMRVFSLVHTSCALITLILPKNDNLINEYHDHKNLQKVEVRS